MKILAIDFSSPQRSVAVVRVDRAEGAVREMRPRLAASEVIETGGRSANLLGLVEEALRQAQIGRQQIGLLAIGLGPGSYTGIRAAIAMAQGWELAVGVKLLGLSSAETIAAQAQAEGILGRVEIVIDAQRGEFYLAGYELTLETRREIEPLRLAGIEEVRAHARAGGTIIGPEVAQWFPEGRSVFPRAAALGGLAANRTDFVPGGKIEPIYLRQTSFVKAPPPRILPD